MPDSSPFTVAEAADRLRVSRQHILALIRAGLLLACNVALPTAQRPLWRIQAGDLAAYLEARTYRPAPRVVRRQRVMAGRFYGPQGRIG